MGSGRAGLAVRTCGPDRASNRRGQAVAAVPSVATLSHKGFGDLRPPPDGGLVYLRQVQRGIDGLSGRSTSSSVAPDKSLCGSFARNRVGAPLSTPKSVVSETLSIDESVSRPAVVGSAITRRLSDNERNAACASTPQVSAWASANALHWRIASDPACASGTFATPAIAFAKDRKSYAFQQYLTIYGRPS